MLAMVVNDNAGWQRSRGVLRFIASKLAPTEKNPMSDHGVFCGCARHGALRASATSLAVVASLVTWR
ncbi:hypothetical protein CES87_04195 [Pseudomonas sp. ERMR1:02]|nr:hypothetical protein CES87_04195 [Pseudomonas sp. ERMR1:02]